MDSDTMEMYETGDIASAGAKRLLKVYDEKIKDSRFSSASLYKESQMLLDGLDYSLKDIECFFPVATELTYNSYNRANIGVFVSAAINRVITSGEEIVLDTKGLETDFIGMNLGGGKVVVEGGAGYHTGHGMKGGVLVIKGGVKDYVGHSMQGGDISVRGNAEDNIGIYSKKGRIWVSGDYKSIGPECGARVYHKFKILDDEFTKAWETGISY